MDYWGIATDDVAITWLILSEKLDFLNTVMFQMFEQC